jgi:type II secretory pathway component PulF
MKSRDELPPLLRAPWRDERAADRFEELASGLDAGLAADTLLPGDPRAAFVERLRRALPLDAAERAQLEAAERSGRLVASLRARAAARRGRAALTRDALRRLPYLLLLAALAVMVAFLAARLSRQPPWIALALLAAAVVSPLALVLWIQRRARDPGFTGRAVPGLAPLLRDLAEASYLEAIGGLYGAGIALPAAHAAAVEAVPLAAGRAGLRRAQGLLEEGHGFGESLAAAGAVDPETLQILASAECAGDLEQAFSRAHQRRSAILSRRLQKAARLATLLLQVAVYGFAVWQILAFYAGYFGRFR